MNILLLGSGGRECALAWKLSQSSLLKKLYIAPGNAGTAQFGQNVMLNPMDFEQIYNFCIDTNITCLVCGPEMPAVGGIYDFFSKKIPQLKIIAPSSQAAMLEGSKAFAKEFLEEFSIPTASYIEVDKNTIHKGIEWFETHSPPYVIKADGLAEGKGVVIAASKEEAEATLNSFIIEEQFGKSSQKVVLEEFLDGLEFSIFVYTCGYQYALLPNAKDYKRRFEGNIGLNTGGMGCISPVPFVDDQLMKRVESEIILPTISGLQQRKLDYTGFIYFGLINTSSGPKVIEYNCRLGDPETQVILPRLKTDLIELFLAGFENKLTDFNVEIAPESCATVILASDGYPEKYIKGFEINGLENVSDSLVFHAGTTSSNEKIITNGGRVLAVSSIANSLSKALEISYQSIQLIHYQGKVYRKDIGFEFI